MAQKVVTQLVDDIDGSEATTTLTFSFNGKSYQIDLNDENSEKFQKALEPYLAVATRTGGPPARSRRARRTAASGGPSPDDVRVWAREQGHTVSERGRIAQSVRDAYDAAH